MAYGLDIYPVYGKYPAVEPLDPRFDRDFRLKKEYQQSPPTKDGGTDHSAIRQALPDRIKWKDSAGRPAPDFDASPSHNVSDRARRIIESVEPGVHGFEPVEYVYSRGDAEQRFWLRVGNRIDGVHGERSNMVLLQGAWYPARDLRRQGLPIPDGIDPAAPSKLTFDHGAVDRYHLWVDQHLSSASVFISDALAERFRAEGFTGLRLEDARVESV